MKKALFLLGFLCIILIASACSSDKRDPSSEYIQPFSFFYRTAETDYSRPDGLISAEVRDLGEKRYTDSELFDLYFQGPLSSDLMPLFPKGTRLISVSRAGTQFFVYLQQTGDPPSAVDQSIATACIAKTVFQMEGFTQVHFRTESLGGQLLQDMTISDSDILLYDSGELQPVTEVVLYFADAEGHLLPEKRTLSPIPLAEQPAYVIEQLLEAPQTAGLRSPLPLGTALLDYNVDLGLCSVDFNADFYNNRPETEREELLVLFSIVNSLCGLDSVDRVQIYVEGRRLDSYVHMDVSHPFSADLTILAPFREDINEFEATICLPGIGDGLLHRLPVRIRIKGGVTKEEALILELLSHQEQNTLLNPLNGISTPLSISVSNQVCTVNFSGHPFTELSEADRQSAVRCLCASLCSLQSISSVEILEEGSSVFDSSISPVDDWFAAGTE